VIQGQPAHRHVVWLYVDAGNNRFYIREQIGMRKDDTLGIARGPGGVLQKSNFIGASVVRKIFDRSLMPWGRIRFRSRFCCRLG
jgi:hypothetical protein